MDERHLGDVRKGGARGRSRKGAEHGETRVGCLIPAMLMFIVVISVLTFAVLYSRDEKQKSDAALRETARSLSPDAFPGDEKGAQEESGVTIGEEPVAKGTLDDVEKKTADDIISSMSTEEKVLQLFMITPEALTGVDEVYAAGTKTQEALSKYPVGGIVYFRQNLRSPDQTSDMIVRTQKYSRDRIGVELFIGLDEEGGQVSRISGREEFGIPAIENMSEIGAAGDPGRAYEVGEQIGTYLSKLGFNLDFAPVADVLTNPKNTVVAKRSFGNDGSLVAAFVKEEMKGLESRGVSAVLKHFPGHGGTAGDTHAGYAYTERTLDEMLAEDLVPFKEGIESGASFIMAGHISAPQVTGNDMPASLSKELITGVLRGKLEFDGVVITDALNMGAITQQYTSSEAAVKAFQAGADMLLMPDNFEEAYGGMLEAVKSGAISEERLEQSLRRILNVKLR